MHWQYVKNLQQLVVFRTNNWIMLCDIIQLFVFVFVLWYFSKLFSVLIKNTFHFIHIILWNDQISLKR